MMRAFVFLCCLPGLAMAAGQLAFEQSRIALTVPAGQKEVVGRFAFTVTGDAPVTIRSTHATCGCTVPDLERRAYQPGETGVLTAKYHPGARQGRQSVRITVQTDSPVQPSVELQLDVDIPELVSVNPRIVFWATGEAANAKVIDIALRTPEPVRITGAESANEDFTVRVEELEPGRRYRLHISPRATDGPYRALIRWTYDTPWTGPVPTAYALIR